MCHYGNVRYSQERLTVFLKVKRISGCIHLYLRNIIWSSHAFCYVFSSTYTIFGVWTVIYNLLKFISCNINWRSTHCHDMKSVLYCRSLYSQSAETFQDSSAQLPIWTSPSGTVYSPHSYHNIVKASALEKAHHTKWRKTRRGNYRNPARLFLSYKVSSLEISGYCLYHLL
jgi:hypothetical protein